MAGRKPGTPKTGGRKPGSTNKATAAREATIAAEGVTPLEYMLRVMRDAAADESKRLDAAKAAAPYVHPRLSAVEMSGTIAQQTHEEWLASLK
ncbi:hypothetical protein ACFQZQ_02960 [Lysobacter koreensis]|uniref:DUF5681 domain-containing protein n=1 Tax=Lysobacter koreensis TaxID=266122 RepID=A0ABW2YIR3_9GAMM